MNTPRAVDDSPSTGHPGWGVLARAIAVLVAALWIFLPLLASASPPDPSWIPGIYDAGDSDDVVNQIGLLASPSDLGGMPAFTLDGHVRTLARVAPPDLAWADTLSPLDRSPPLL
jgi:hypothetical protein